MGSFKLQSFEDFSVASKAAAEAKIQEEQKSARRDAAYQFETLLSEFGVTSVKDLSEEDRSKFFTKLGASEISESVAIIEEGTRSQVGKIGKSGKITSVYMHYDGYPDHMLPTIKKGYKDGKNVDILLKKGGGSGLEADPAKINFYGDKATTQGNVKNIKKYIKDAEYDGGAEFVYLFDERDGKWYMADTYEDQELKPAFESVNDLVINEKFVPSKGNSRDAKKVAKTLEQIMMSASALVEDDTTHFGAVRYLVQNALEDANFHSYIEPVGKALGGKIRTINVKINKLGDMEIPVGAKTIQKFLDTHYSALSQAAGWSGIGIVEGVALYLDGWGFGQAAQKMVDKFNFIYANESVANEGNAFLAARAIAIEEEADEFEFNGKTYPVIKEAEEVNENKYARAGKLGYNDQFLDKRKSLSATLATELGFDPKKPWSEGIGFDHVAMYAVGDKEGTIADDALTGKYTYDELLAMAKEFLGESNVIVEKDDAGTHLDKLADLVGNAKSLMDVGKELKRAGYKYDFSTSMLPMYTINADGFKFAIINKRYVDKGDREVGDIAIGLMESSDSVEIEEGNAFGAARAEAIAKGDDKFKVGDEEYPVEDVDAKDKENAEEFANEEGVTEDEIEIKVDGDYEIEVEKEDEESEEAPAEETEEEATEESATNEAEVKSDEDFKEYAFSVLQKAFGEDFDETKAQEVVDGLLSKHGEDYGAMVGALQASMG